MRPLARALPIQPRALAIDAKRGPGPLASEISVTLRWTVPLLLLLLTGCASTRGVRLETGEGRPLEYMPSTWDSQVEVGRAAFEEALTRLVLEVPLSLRPSQAGGWVRASSVGPTLDTTWNLALRKDYGRWCRAHESPGDCLSLLEDGLGFGEMDRLTVALGLALEPMRESIAHAVEETLSPRFFYAVVVTGLASWVALLAVPEPVVTKAAAVLTAVMIVYLGVGPFLEVVKASFALKQATDRATTFTELEEAGTRFGKTLGTEGARVFILALSLLLGRGGAGGGAWLASRLPLLPSFSQAAVLGASGAGLKLGAVGGVSAVAVVEGQLVITLAPTAVAMAALEPVGGAILGDPDGQLHHICTDKNELSDANGGPWTPVYEALFGRAGMSLNDPANKVRIRGHRGPHPEEYHELVFERLRRALGDCRNVAQCRQALVGELRRLAEDLTTPGSYLRQLVTPGGP